MDLGNWQLVAALLCVAAAVGILLRRAVALFQGPSGGCGTGGCGSCPSDQGSSPKEPQGPLVSLDLPERDRSP